jgi:tetratricopeptide (TPR) repeat protein
MTMASEGNPVPAAGAAAGRRPAWRRLWWLGGAVLLAGLAWWRWGGPGPPPVPPVPLGHADPAVREAVEAARREVREQPRSAAAWGHLAMLLHVHDFAEQAMVCYAEAEKLQPNEPRWYYHHGDILIRIDPEAGLRLLRRAVELSGESAFAPRLRLAEWLLAHGRTREARVLFQRLSRRAPHNPRVQLGLGKLAYQRRDWQQSLQHLKLSVASPVARKSSSVLLVAVYRRLGQTARASALAGQASQWAEDLRWEDPWAEQVLSMGVGQQRRLARAQEFRMRGEPLEALRLLRDVARDYPNALSYTRLGEDLLRVGRAAEAEEALRHAVALGGPTVEACANLGIALFSQAESRLQQSGPSASSQRGMREAADCFRTVLRLQPNHAYAHYNLGLCWKYERQPTRALAAFQRAIQCQPEFVDAHLELARTCLAQGQDAAALAAIQNALVLTSAGDAQSRKLLARLLARSCCWH